MRIAREIIIVVARRGTFLNEGERSGSFYLESNSSSLPGLANAAIEVALAREGNETSQLWNQRSLFREFKAKTEVGYNAYGKYHCQYYKDSHVKTPILGDKHEAYQ